jgi:uncharacterized protein (TIGR00297 family)
LLVARPSGGREMMSGPGSPLRVISALAFSGGIGLFGWRRKALSKTGALGAVVIGGPVYLAGTWRWSAVIVAFFASSSALSRSRRTTGPALDRGIEPSDGPRRTLTQTLANGGVSGVAALTFMAWPSITYSAAFAGSIAAANADTWATEIGGTSTAVPRMINSGKVAVAGTSGAVSARGLAAAAAGSVLIGIVAGAVIPELRTGRRVAAVGTAGFCGSIADSLAGALVQARNYCPVCEKPTEQRVHHCGATTIHRSGWRWCTNDAVNVICTMVGAGIAALLSRR